MYRRHLRMALARDLEMQKSRSEFLQKITSIPMVYIAWNIATDTYNTLKESNKLIKTSLNTTEKAALLLSEPVIRRFEKQLKSADELACRGLQTLQGILPYLMYHREKLIKHTKDVYDDTVESGLKKFETVKKLSITKVTDYVNDGNEKFEEFLASPYGEACEVAVDFVLDTGEMYVDHYLPPLGDERPEKLFGDRAREPMTERADHLKNRLKERLYKHTLLKVQSVRLRTRIFVIKIYQFNLYQYLVETSAAVPGMVFTTIFHVFTTVEALVSYVVSLYKNQPQSIV